MTTTVATYILQRLQQCGVEHLFAVPGDYAGPFLEALDQFSGIERVPNINELGSGYAADGYGRYKGVGAACIQYGVGGFSILNCTAGSFVERVPVVVISASPKTKDRLLEKNEEILFHHSTGDLRADQIVFQNVTVASEIIRSGETAPEQIDLAFTAMLTHSRPIYIEVLQDVWTMNCAAPEGTLAPTVQRSNPHALTAALDAAWARLQAASLPVIWAGVEIKRYGLAGTLQELVEASAAPFTTTSLGKTVLDESQPQFIGTYAGPASPEWTRKIVDGADCILALGTIITDDYLDIMANSFAAMIEVNDEEARIGYQYYQQVTLRDFLEGLVARFKEHGPLEFNMPAADLEPPLHNKPEDPLTYNNFYDELSNFLQSENLFEQSSLILGESTSLYVFGNLFGMPQDSFVAQAAWGSLGHETGCALGVALGSGRRPFVVAGDGGFRMICQEMSSLAYHKSNAVVFVMSNNAYAIEQAFVDINAFTPNGAFAAFDVLPVWDYVALAQAFGAKGHRVQTIEELRAALATIKDVQGVPSLVEVVIPQKDLAPQLARLAATPPPKRKYRRA
ncbi:MAG: thiamine pyrophosphate-binding protein [Acidobacteriota bacterium]|nr:thiamine pyrophosphate-binding protein [Acidobacteriota bacterium]